MPHLPRHGLNYERGWRMSEPTLGQRAFGGATLLQRIFKSYKKEQQQSKKLATALDDLVKCIEADDLISPNVSYMRQAKAALILFKASESLRIEKAWGALKKLMTEEN